MNIKKKNLALIIIATFVFTALLSCGVFALVAKSVSFNMVMHLNPTVYFGLELQVDSNGDGDFSDSFTSNNVAFNESTVYTIFDNRITNFVDHEPWAIVNLNKIVLQNTDALNNPLGDLGVNACFKIKVLNYTSPEMLEVDANSAEMQALWLTLNPTEFSSMYAVPEYGVQNVAYGSFKEFMIYPQSITTDYFEIPFTVELKTKTIDHEIVLVNNTNGSVELGSIQTHVTNGENYKMTFKTPFDVVTLASVKVGTSGISYTYANNTLEISGNYISNLTADNDLIITIDLVGDFLTTGINLNTAMNNGIPTGMGTSKIPNTTIKTIIFEKTANISSSTIAGITPVNLNNNPNKNTIKLYITADTCYILSDYQIFANLNCTRMFSQFTAVTTTQLNNLNTQFTIYFTHFFYNCNKLTSVNVSAIQTDNAKSLTCMFEGCWNLQSLNLSHFNTNNVADMYGVFASCISLTSLNISSFRTHNVENMGAMFINCELISTIDLTFFNTKNVIGMARMFQECSALETIYVSDYWTTTAVTDSSSMFLDCSVNLKGGNGTTWASTNLHDKTYAVYDGQEGKLGYFTYKKVTVAL